MDLSEEVKAAGYGIIGPARSVSVALTALEKSLPDAALLDVNLTNETSYPVAECLAGRGVPFAFLTGYAGDQLHDDFRDRSVLSKPVHSKALRAALSQLLSTPTSHAD